MHSQLFIGTEGDTPSSCPLPVLPEQSQFFHSKTGIIEIRCLIHCDIFLYLIATKRVDIHEIQKLIHCGV